jgi:YidC/Oxa1 family membrane protein insertase
MSDIRRSILWVVFGFSLILLWDKWQVHNGRQPTFFPGAAVTEQAQASAGEAPASAELPSASSAIEGAQAAVPGADARPATTTAQRHEVTTDVYRLVFSSEGGALVGATLLQHASGELGTPPFELLAQDARHTYVAQTGLIGGNFPNHKTPMTLVPGPTALADGQDELVVRFESEDLGGVKLVKSYTLRRGSYAIDVSHEVVNTGEQPVSPQLYVQLVRDGSKGESETPFYSTFTGPAVYTSAQKYQKVEFKHIDDNKADFERTANDGYVAMVQHYFASAWLLPDGTPRENFVRKVGNLYAVGAITPLPAVAPGERVRAEARLFVGPQEEKVLERLAPGLELVKDYGMFTILAKPLYWLLEKIHGFVGNWGWSIVLLVLLIKAAFYWLNASAYRSMAKMKKINPRIMEMRERLKNNPQAMQQEMMKIYREEKVNPLGGCLPIVIQIPVFIALYWVLLSSVEMRNAPWVGWITDLSSKDPYYVLPVVMTLTTLVQTALNPLPPDPVQARMMWIMPLIFSVFFFFFPAGLVLYWITNNILTIAQQAFINHRLGVPVRFTLPTELFRNKS